MPEGDYDAVGKSGCVSGAAGIVLGMLLILAVLCVVGCATAPPAPEPLPHSQPAPQVIVDRIPVYDPCPPPAYLPRPILWPLLVDGIQAPALSTKLTVIEQYGQSWQWWGDDLAGQLDVYREPVPTPTPAPR